MASDSAPQIDYFKSFADEIMGKFMRLNNLPNFIMRNPIINEGILGGVDQLRVVDDAKFEEIKATESKFPGSVAANVAFLTAILERVDANSCAFKGLQIRDSRILSSDFANAKCEKMNIFRTEFIACRMTGFQAPEAIVKEVLFQRSKLDLSLFRFSKLQDVAFDHCILIGADFLGAELEKVIFRDCDLTDTEFSQAKIKEIDVRGSKIENIRLQKDLVGTIKVDTGQALYLSSLFGLQIED